MAKTSHKIFGLMAEFEHGDELLAATRRAYEAGYRKMDAYTPFPIHGLAEAIGFHHSRLPLIVLIGGLTGTLTAFLLQWYPAVIDYPVNIGGRPLNSWPAFVPIMFELTVLFASFSAVFGMLGLNGLPQPYHPVFNVERFQLASKDRFFLCIQSNDPKFDVTQTRQFLEELRPYEIAEVAP